ncbi:MAG: hypothetical protein HZA11_07545 [Nitrospirae bacterium]|nr:hypothetical protein [Nitrospirota bacterium]
MPTIYTEDQVRKAISSEKAKHGIKKYREIMELFNQTNVAEDRVFQTMFNGFYRVRQKPEEWYKTYYNYMERQKGKDVTFSATLKYIKDKLNRDEPSFSSKLVATHNPNMPIWDKHVLENLCLRPPYHKAKNKVAKIEALYEELITRYKNIENTQGPMMIGVFNDLIEEAQSITNIKKLDFILWQIRT